MKLNLRYFSEKKEATMVDNLLKANENERMLNKLTALQNEISVAFDTKVLAIASINEDRISSSFAKGLADAYAKNGSTVLIIDANLYNPCLATLLGKKEQPELVNIASKVDAFFMKKETYPSSVYKGNAINDLVESNSNKYDHIIILVPAVKDHKEVTILGRIINSVLLVARRDVTKKRDIFEALRFLALEKIPVSKTVIIK